MSVLDADFINRFLNIEHRTSNNEQWITDTNGIKIELYFK